MKWCNILRDIFPKSVLFTRQYLMDLIYRRGLVVRHGLPLIIAIIIVLVVSDVLILFLRLIFWLVLWKEFHLSINFTSKLVDKFLEFIVFSVKPFQCNFPTALYFIDLNLYFNSRNRIIWGFCLVRKRIASHEHFFEWKRFFVYWCCIIRFHFNNLETETFGNLSEQLEDFTLSQS